VNRPVADMPFWNSVLAFMSQFHYFAVWPGGRGPVFSRDDTEIPDGLNESLGQPIQVRSANQIPELIASS
jgi:hypothetical protein